MTDITLNPLTPVTNGALVSTSNPLPATTISAPTAGTNVAINPTVFVVNGAIVSATNPLPITLV